jgi:hypothetical protein
MKSEIKRCAWCDYWSFEYDDLYVHQLEDHQKERRKAKAEINKLGILLSLKAEVIA